MIEEKEDQVIVKQNIVKDETILQLKYSPTKFIFEQFYGLGTASVNEKLYHEIGDNNSDNQTICQLENEELFDKCISARSNKVLNNFPQTSFKSFKDVHKLLTAHDNITEQNSEVRLDHDHNNLNVVATRDISSGEHILLNLDRKYWLRRKLVTSNNAMEKLIILIFLELFNKPETLPEKLKKFELFFTKWRSWSDETCAEFLKTVVTVDPESQFVDMFDCRGYSVKVLLYRMLQTLGCVSPPSGADYKYYPEALRNMTHQSRDLCFWPVMIAPETEQTEVLRRKMFDGLEFGPNASWVNFPKTKQVFMAAKRDNIDALKDVSEDTTVNLNAYGTCHYWTPLHVACFYGSQKVVKFLLQKKVIFNSVDRDGKTPLNLAEENGHGNLAKMIVAHAANESVLPDTRTEIRNLPSDTDPKMSSLEAAINCKNVGNNAYKNSNYKTAFQLYSRGIHLCPDNHPQLVILLSNRAQVLITARAHNLALRDIDRALNIDPGHDKTILRRAHCYEALHLPAKSLMDLDLLLYISVPDKLVHNRRNMLFLQTLVDNKDEAAAESKDENSDKVIEDLAMMKIGETEYCLHDISMSTLMYLSLDDLRLLDRKIGLYDNKQT